MRKFKGLLYFFIPALLILLITNNFVKAEEKYPSPAKLKYVNDYVGVIDKPTTELLVSIGKELEDKTGAQAAVVIINTLNGENIESFANGLFREWGIGQKDKNNGLLMLVIIKERKWRIEVGKGLEGAITDIYSSRVMDELAKPSFKTGDYNEGIKKAFAVFADAIAKEYNSELEKNVRVEFSNQNANDDNGDAIASIMIIIIVILIVLIYAFKKPRGRGYYSDYDVNNNNTIGGGFFYDSSSNSGSSSGDDFGSFGGGDSGGGGSSGDW